MERRGLKEYFKNNLLSLSVFIILMISGIVVAGNVIVNEGNLEVGNNLNVSNVLFVDSTNRNVGIGTTTPSAKLDVGGIAQGTNYPSTLGVYNSTDLGATAGSYIYPMEVQGKANHNLRLQTALYRRAASGSSEWINTSYRIQYAVDSSFTDGSKAFIELGASDPAANAGGFISLGTSGADRLSISSTGNVGIGTTSPAHKFQVVTGTEDNVSIRDRGGNPALYFEGSGGYKSFVDMSAANMEVVNEGSGNLGLGTDNTIDITIITGGNVGIGTTSPTAGIELDVEGQAECDGAGCWTVESDLAYKENVVNLSKYGLNDVLKIQPREYDYRAKANNSLSGNHSFGFVAQELKLIVPEIVYGEEGSMSIGYGGLTPVLVKAIQEQQTMIQQMRATLCSDGHTEYC